MTSTTAVFATKSGPSDRSSRSDNQNNSQKCRQSTGTTEGLQQELPTSRFPGKGSSSSGRNNNINNSSPQVKNENHHNNNCAADNNNQKRNTDDVAAEHEQSVRSSSSSSASRVLRKPDLHHSPAPSGISASVQRIDSKSLKMVAQEVCDSAAMDAAGLTIRDQLVGRTEEETAEELKYGPGIVQKLRSRFMSYTMRLNAAKNQRPSLQNMRRATSLNNLLDDDEDSTRTVSPVAHSQTGGNARMSTMNGQAGDKSQPGKDEMIRYRHSMGATNGLIGDREVSGDGQCDGLKKYQNEMLRSRQLRRGNESLKRARSVETLRYDSKAWERDIQMTTNNNENLMEVILNGEPQQRAKDVNIEERIVKARERGDPRPMRLKSFMDDTERPPPDLVKTTLMKFEATANRRGRAPTSRNGEVAAKVATYKSILEKPAILYPKPPLSPKKPVIKPRTSLHGPSTKAAAVSARSPSPLLIHVDMTYKQSTPPCPDRRNGSNLSPQTPPDLLINSIGARSKSGSQMIQQQQNGGYESPITQLANKLKSMHLQSPAVVGGGVGKAVAAPPAMQSDNGGGGNGTATAPIEVGISASNSSASTTTSSATSSPVPPHSGSGSGSVTGSYFLNGGSSAGGRLELGDVSAEDCYEYRDYDDPDDEQEEEQDVDGRDHLKSHVDEEEEGSNNPESNDAEGGQDDEIDQVVTKRINKADLQSIGQAGTTQEFHFRQAANNNNSHLPVVPPRTGAKFKQQQQSPAEKMRFVPSGLGGGVVAQAPAQIKRENGHSLGVQEVVLVSEGGGAEGETDVDDCKTTTALLIKQIKEEATRKFGTGPGLRDNNNQVVVSSASGAVVNSNSCSGGGLIKGSSSSNGISLNNSNGHNHTNGSGIKSGVRGNSDTRQALTNREIEKNLINVGKSNDQAKDQQGTPPAAGAAAVVVAKKKSWQEEPQTNTMVFNFSQRKDVPDYIDSDGMILLPNRKRELPKVIIFVQAG